MDIPENLHYVVSQVFLVQCIWAFLFPVLGGLANLWVTQGLQFERGVFLAWAIFFGLLDGRVSLPLNPPKKRHSLQPRKPSSLSFFFASADPDA
jgi:hypothetical protein